LRVCVRNAKGYMFGACDLLYTIIKGVDREIKYSAERKIGVQNRMRLARAEGVKGFRWERRDEGRVALSRIAIDVPYRPHAHSSRPHER